MEGISLQYPAWFLLLCIILGLFYAFILYFRTSSFRDKPQWFVYALGIVRFLAATGLAILLLSPILKSIITEVRDPIILVAQDRSESILTGMNQQDSLDYVNNMNQLITGLSESFTVEELSFGDGVREGIDWTFEDKVTNLSDVFSHIYDTYSHQNIGAIVLATDGIYNEGMNPLYRTKNLSVPILTVALGDTTPQKDILIKRVLHNNLAYLDDRFSIQVDVSAQNLSASQTRLSISKLQDGKFKKLEERVLQIDRNDFFQTEEFILDADQAGVQQYRISTSSVSQEISRANNTKTIFVDILDARQKILVLGAAAHPDLSAWKQLLSKNKNYEIVSSTVKDWTGQLVDFDFIIMHQLPSSNGLGDAIAKDIRARKMPALFVLGAQSDFRKFNESQGVIEFTSSAGSSNDIQATVDKQFEIFKIQDKLKTQLPNFAPLKSPFGEYRIKGDAKPLLYQRIGKIDTQYPLLAFGSEDGIKYGVLSGEGIWKWRLFDYLQNDTHELTDELFTKVIQYLAEKQDKRKFRVSSSKNIYRENEDIQLDAELYNAAYELVNQEDVQLSIRDSEGNEYNFVFDKTAKSYSINAGKLPVSDYRYTAKVFNANKEEIVNGQFSVRPIELELYESTADHNLLTSLSEKYGGSLFYPSDLSKGVETIKGLSSVKPVMYQTSKTQSIINLRWICGLLILLLCLEWFLRRYFGSY